MAFPGEINFNYYRGDTYEFNVYPKLAGGSLMDLTNYTAKFYVATTRRSGGATPIECVAEVITTTGTNHVKCTIIPETGKTLDPTKTYYYDVQITSVDGTPKKIYTLLTGTISITDEVTESVIS